jgi:uncharacterized SAM-binding protein YcdF (DUF218 family)
MNELLLMFGIESWKPILAALVLPPLPVLLLVLLGARLMPWRRGVGWLVLILAVALLWLSACIGAAEWLNRSTRAATGMLTEARLAELRKQMAAAPANKPTMAVVVLGGGRDALALEYGVASLREDSLLRLRYGLHVSRVTGIPVLYSGGVGHADVEATAEADIAADIAAREYGRPLRWIENRSRDTRENARFSILQLRDVGVSQVILVTNGWHMKRALRAFKQEAQAQGYAVELTAAPMGLGARSEKAVLRWMPSGEGLKLMRQVLREQLALLMGA